MQDTTCKTCKGKGHVEMRLRDLSGKKNFLDNWHIVPCDMCHGKGHITQEDRDNYRKSWQL